MGKKILNYAELKTEYNNLLSEKSDILELQKEIKKQKEIIKILRKEIIELSYLVKVSK